MEYEISSVVLRSVFRSKKEGVAGGWRWLEKHEIQHRHYSPLGVFSKYSDSKQIKAD
jgi:hypothetical protein